MKLIFKAVVIIIVLLYGCEDNSVQSEEDARINFQEGTIEGVKTGDDTTTVIQKLGMPDWVGIGDLDGFIYNYENQGQPGIAVIMVTFMNKSSDSSSPDYRVISIWAQNSYEGKSREGIGINTLRADVNTILGEPKTTSETTDVYEFSIQTTKINIITFIYDQDQKIRIIIISS